MADNRIYIGMMRAKKRPTGAALAAAHAALMLDADFCFFNPTEVDLVEGSIRGWRYDKTRWRRCKIPFPDVIINDLASMRYRKVWRELSRRIPFTSPLIGDKVEISNRMSEGDFYDFLQIPMTRLSSYNDFQNFLNVHKRIVIKPQYASHGENVFFFGIEGEKYRVNIGTAWTYFDNDELRSFYEETVGKKAFIAQRYIESMTRQGIPFDIRMHVRRNRKAEWSVIRVYPRIGEGRSITSNVTAGGSVAPLKAFLEAQFGDVKGREIRKQLLDLAAEMPERFQALYQDRVLDALGIDIGIDPAGQPWLFEINPFPWSSFFDLEAAIAKIGYAIHLARNSQSVAQKEMSEETT
jgi:glutathione synthase/RimK-type ligase-like ATP-grasp enzyme